MKWQCMECHDANEHACIELTCTSCIICRNKLSSNLGYRLVKRGMPKLFSAVTNDVWKGSTGQSRVSGPGKNPLCMLIFH